MLGAIRGIRFPLTRSSTGCTRRVWRIFAIMLLDTTRAVVMSTVCQMRWRITIVVSTRPLGFSLMIGGRVMGETTQELTFAGDTGEKIRTGLEELC